MSNPYDPPTAPPNPAADPVDPLAGPWRDGDHVVTRSGGTWPRRCVVCNGAGTVPFVAQLRWSPPGERVLLLFLLLLGVLPYLVARAFTLRRAAVRVHLCAAHAARRRALSVAVPAALVAVAVAGMALAARTDVAGFTLLSVAGVVGALFLPRPLLGARGISGGLVTVAGVGPAFAAALPPADRRPRGLGDDLPDDLPDVG